jgi:hypothetical protein
MLGRVNFSEKIVEVLPPRDAIAGAPAAYSPMGFHGGPLISAPEFVSLYWGPFSSSDIDTMQNWLAGFADYLSGSGAPLGQEQVLLQYGTEGATVGPWHQESSAPASATEADVKNLVTTLQAAGNLPPFSAERLFLIFTKGVSFAGYGTSWCAYHGDWGAGSYFAICPYPSAGGCGSGNPVPSWQSVTSHEITEACTDPVPGQGWIVGAEEGGDVCAWQEVTMPFGTMQRFADNLQQACSVWTSLETPHISAVAWGPDRLDIFVRGTDGAVYHKYWSPGTGWGPSVDGWEWLGGNIVGSPKVVSWGPNRLDIFVKGLDGALYHKYWSPGTGWGPSVSDWEWLGGVIVGDIDVVSWGPERLDIFVVGTDGAMYHKYWSPGTGWGPSVSDYEWLGGVIVGSPAAVSWGPERLDIFVRGTDDAMYHKYWSPGTGWGPSVSDYEWLGGVLTAGPVPVSWAPERLDIFVVGTDDAMYHMYWSPGTGWGPGVNSYEWLGGVLVGPPAPVSWGSERLDIFVRGTDGAMYHMYWSPGTGWGPGVNNYEWLGGILIGSPIPVSWGPERLDIFVQGTDDAMYHMYWSPGTGWGPGVNSYEWLGGVLG